MRPSLARASFVPAAAAAVFLAAMRPDVAAAQAAGQHAGHPAPGWISLFDGKTTAGWHPYGKPGAPPAGWSVVDGALTRTGEGSDIVSDGEFADFELELEWKVAPAGNSGIFYRATESTKRIFHNAAEMQVLDNERHPDNKTPLTLAGANYALYPAPATAPRPVGEWNQVRIVAKGAHVEHWLNGKKLLEFELWSPDWEARVKKSKFVEFPAFGRSKAGHVGLQNHGDWVAFRNIRVRELK